MKVTLTIDSLTVPVGIEMLKSIASALKDDEGNRDLFHILAQSTSAGVRAEIAYKNSISEETALLLLSDKDSTVLTRMIRNDVTGAVMNESIFESILSISSEEMIEDIIGSIGRYEDLSLETIMTSLIHIGSASIDLAIARESSTPKKILKNLLKHEDPDVVMAAKKSLS